MQPDHDEFLKALGKRLRELRIERGWTVSDMLICHGYSDSHWRKYETGAFGGLTVDSLLRMASVFGLTLIELLDGISGEFPKKSISADERNAAVKVSGRAARKTAAKKITSTGPLKTAQKQFRKSPA